MKLVRLILTVVLVLSALILEDQIAYAQLVWNPTIFAPAVNPPGGANNYGESSGQGGFIYTGPIAPANPTEGMLWYDNSTVPQTLKIWDGTTWVTVLGQTADNSGPTPPSNPTDGQLWYDTSTLPATLKVWDGTTWVTVRAGILNSPTFAGSITILNNATVNGPDGSTWTNSGINNLKNLNIATGGALTFHGVPIGGACAANQFMISLSSEIIPTCAAITNIPGPVTINNPTFTGTVTMPDGSVWNNTSLTYPNTTVINGPDGSVWNSTGITNVKNISLVTGGAITIGGQPVSGGAHVGPTAPASPSAGQLWWDTSVTPAVLKIYNGTAWVVAGGGGGVTSGTTPPSPPTTGTLWYDTSTTPPTLKVWNGTAWVATNSAIVAPTAPSNASEGQFWFNTTDIQTYVRFNGQWVAVVNIVGGGGGAGVTVGPTAPASPKTGELWYDSVAGALKVWNGSTWASTAPSGAAPSSITDAMLVSAYSGIGTCSANQYVTALNRNAAPTCAAVTLPAGVTLNNPTLTGTITLPDGSTWTSAGLTIVAGSRAHTLDSLTGASGSTAGALTRASNGSWSVAAFSLPSGSTIVSPTISNPTFAGTLTFPSASIADAALANSYSGVGTCTAGQFVNALNRNAGPTCASPSAGNFAPFVNPSAGQNNYAPLANAAFTGTMTINGVSLTNGPWLPVNNPAFTGAMTGSASGTQFVSLSTASNQAIPWRGALSLRLNAANANVGNPIGPTNPPTAYMLSLTANGNWPTIVNLMNSGTGAAADTVYYMGNDANEYASISLTNTGWNIGGANIARQAGFLTDAKNGMEFNSAVQDMKAGFQFWHGGINVAAIGGFGNFDYQAVGMFLSDPLPGRGAYAAYYAANDLYPRETGGTHYVAMQMCSSDNIDMCPPDSALFQAAGNGGTFLNSIFSPIYVQAPGEIDLNVLGVPSRSVVQVGTMGVNINAGTAANPGILTIGPWNWPPNLVYPGNVIYAENTGNTVTNIDLGNMGPTNTGGAGPNNLIFYDGWTDNSWISMGSTGTGFYQSPAWGWISPIQPVQAFIQSNAANGLVITSDWGGWGSGMTNLSAIQFRQSGRFISRFSQRYPFDVTYWAGAYGGYGNVSNWYGSNLAIGNWDDCGMALQIGGTYTFNGCNAYSLMANGFAELGAVGNQIGLPYVPLDPGRSGTAFMMAGGWAAIFMTPPDNPNAPWDMPAEWYSMYTQYSPEMGVEAPGMRVANLGNVEDYPPPTVKNGKLMLGSRDTFGDVHADSWPVTMTFAERENGEPSCTANSAGGIPGILYTNAQHSDRKGSSIEFWCEKPGGGVCGVLWFSYHCAGTGNS